MTEQRPPELLVIPTRERSETGGITPTSLPNPLKPKPGLSGPTRPVASDRDSKAVFLIRCIEGSKENIMSPSPHTRVAELHNLAAHAHADAAVAHGKGDHLTAHELSKQALEHSRNALKLSEELATKFTQSRKAEGA